METATGCLALRLAYASASLSNCATWQAICNSSTAAAAASHIYEESLPPPRNGRKYAPGELAGFAPFALLRAANLTRTRIASPTGFDADGDIDLRISWLVPDALRYDLNQSARQFNNIVGSIVDELCAQADTPGRLALSSITMPESWERTEDDKSNATGIWQIADLVLSAPGI